VDNDCNGLTDELDPQCDPKAAACPDLDKDGYADCLVPGCNPKGLDCGDCNDSLAAVSPKGLEGPMHGLSCTDYHDNDCDGATDSELPECAAVAPPAAGIDDWDAPKPATTTTSGAGGGDAGAGGGSSAGGSQAGSGVGGDSPTPAKGSQTGGDEGGCHIAFGNAADPKPLWFFAGLLGLFMRRRRTGRH